MVKSKKEQNSAYYQRNKKRLIAKASIKQKEYALEGKRSEWALNHKANLGKDVVASRRRGYRKMPKPTRAAPALCECCGKPPVRGYVKALVIDHDHLTGIFRGWLCGPCNLAIGILGDYPSGVRAALTYLERAYAAEK